MALLQIQDLEFSYSGRTRILSGIDCGLDAGESMLIIGDNGSGKTTLGRLLAGLLEPSKGSITINGITPQELPPVKRCKVASYIQQISHLSILGASIRNELHSFARGSDRFSVEKAYGEFAARHSLPRNTDCNPRDLPSPDLWRFVACLYAFVLNPHLLVIDEIPCPGNPLQSGLIAEILEKRREQHQCTVLFYQRTLPFNFDSINILEDQQLNNSAHV